MRPQKDKNVRSTLEWLDTCDQFPNGMMVSKLNLVKESVQRFSYLVYAPIETFLMGVYYYQNGK